MEATASEPHEATQTPHRLAEVGAPYRFTTASGSETAKRRWDAERLRKEQQASGKGSPQVDTEANEDARARLLKKQLDEVQEQVALASNRLTNALSDPKASTMDIDRLTRSYATLLERERIIAGRSLPPTVKATQVKPSRQSRGTFVEPI